MREEDDNNNKPKERERVAMDSGECEENVQTNLYRTREDHSSLSLSKLFRSRCLPLGMFRSNTCPISDSSDTYVADLDHSFTANIFQFCGALFTFCFFFF